MTMPMIAPGEVSQHELRTGLRCIYAAAVGVVMSPALVLLLLLDMWR